MGFSDNNAVNYHYLLTQSGIEPILFNYFMEKFEENNVFEEKKRIFEENKKINEGIIQNLDKIEELIKEWERESSEKMQNKKLNREEFFIESDSSLKFLSNDEEFSIFKKRKKRKKEVEKQKEIITIIE